MAHGKFGTMINCIDGRTQHPVYDWLIKEFGLDYVDAPNVEGPDKLLSEGSTERIDILKNKVSISVNGHHSKVIAVVGHYDCAANPVSDEEHKIQIKKGCKVVESWNFRVRVLGLWVNQINNTFEVSEVVYDSEKQFV